MYTILFSLSLIFLFFTFTSPNAFGAQPALPASVQIAPFYWSEDGLGIEILKNFNLPLDPYLTPGVTDQSSDEEILQAYLEANSDLTVSIIVPEDDRAQIIVAHFSSGEISGVKTITTFSNFTPKNPFVTGEVEFSLESLPSLDKLDFYEFVKKWKDESSALQLFDVDIEIIAGDGTTIQIWEYASCQITDYVLFKMENKDFFAFSRGFHEEFRDKTTFLCGAFTLNTEQKQSDFQKPNPKDFVPDDSQRVQTFTVRFDERLLGSTPPFTTFSKFTHFFDTQDIPIHIPVELPEKQIPGKTFEGKTQFSLESLPNKEHEIFYQVVNNWIVGIYDYRFDVYIDFITGDGTILQTWEYFECGITDYSTFLMESVLIYTFTGLHPTEIRDKTIFTCSAFRLGLDQDKSTIAEDIVEPANFIPDENSRAQIFVAHFSSGKIAKPITLTSFSKFTPSNPLDSRTSQFSLESLPSKDKQQVYQLVQDWLEDTFTDRFDVDIDVTSGDGTILQTWEYRNCDIIDYYTLLNDKFLTSKFGGGGLSKIRDVLSFDCGALSLNTSQRESSLDVSEINVVDFVPNSNSSAQKFVVYSSGGMLEEKIGFETFSKFTPYSPFDKRGLGFTLESLPSKEMIRFYQFINEWKMGDQTIEPIDVDIELVTGDGTSLQTWQFRECEITDYVTYLYDKLLNIKFHDLQNSEIRDKTSFDCRAFYLDVEQKPSTLTTNSIPNNDQRAQKFIVQFSDGMIERPITITVPKFIPVNSDELALAFPGKTFDTKPQFMLSSLPNKDLIPLYQAIGDWESKAVQKTVFDVDIDVVSLDDTLIQTWHYAECQPTNYYTTLYSSILLNPFSQEFGSEIRDNYLFDCRFFDLIANEDISIDSKDSSQSQASIIASPFTQMNQGKLPDEIRCKEGYELILKPNKDSAACIKPSSLEKLGDLGWIHVEKSNIDKPKYIPSESDRAESFTVRISGGIIEEEKLFKTFSNFAPISEKANIPLSIPNYPFDSTFPHFVLEGLPSKDKVEFYQMVNDWLTQTETVELFDVSIDVLSGDQTILQTWEYRTCEIIEYLTTLVERLDKIKYHDKYASEIIDKTTIRCSVLDINPGV